MPAGARHVKLFRNGRNQAVRIPVEFEMPGNDALLSRDGERLVITPFHRGGLSALLDSWTSITEGLPEADDSPVKPEEVF